MFSFLIISGNSSIFYLVRSALSKIGQVSPEADGRIVARDENGDWIAFQPILNISDDYEEGEMGAVLKMIENPSFYLIEGRWSESRLENKLLIELNDCGSVAIDNDHGAILSLHDVKERIDSGVEWLRSSS